MKKIIRSALAGVGAAATLALAAGPALAATPPTPPWQPGGSPGAGDSTQDSNNVGTIALYDSAGNQISGGNSTQPVAAYIVATGLTPRSGNNKAPLSGFTPVKGSNEGSWSGETLGAATVYPPASGPFAGSTKPVHSNDPSTPDLTLEDLARDYPNTNTDPNYANIYELRVRTSGTAGADSKYASGDFLLNPTAHTFTQVYPTVTTPAPNPVVPEVSVAALLPLAGLGAAGLVVLHRRRRTVDA